MRTWHGKGELECIHEKLECVPSDAAVTSKDSLKFVWTGCASVKAFQCPSRLLGKSYGQEGFCSLTLSWIHEVGYRPRLATTLKSALVVVMKRLVLPLNTSRTPCHQRLTRRRWIVPGEMRQNRKMSAGVKWV